jgi:hypothetical protein
MKPLLIILFLISASIADGQVDVISDKTYATYSNSFDQHTQIISFGFGLPNLYRMQYEEPVGYHHVKTTGFGPVYFKFEFAGFKNVGLQASYAYSTFHYSYDGGTGQAQPIFYDDVNAMNLTLSGNYHFGQWIANPRLDLYAGAGVCISYLRYRYGNIPPYKEPSSKAGFLPVGRVGIRYYINPILSFYLEAGYDGLSIIQPGFSVRF